MGLLDTRVAYKPFEYEWQFELYNAHEKMHWHPDEVNLNKDLRDFKSKLTEGDRNLITQIFRFFTQGDKDVMQGYYDLYIPKFKLPETRMMLGGFAGREAVHQHAYSLLLDTLGMPEKEYSAFTEYKAMADKHDYLTKCNIDTTEGLLKSVAIYSAFTEGLQLFSSFIMLLNFSRFNSMQGMSTIIDWSIRDETVHVEGMTKLFRTLVQENIHVWTDSFKAEIYEACRDMVKLEFAFIDLAFEMGDLQGLTANGVKEYIKYIADRRLLQLGLKPNYGVKENPLPWVDFILNGVGHSNFFETRGTEYAKASLTGSWDTVWA